MEMLKDFFRKFEEDFMKLDKLIMMLLANLFTVFFFSLTNSMFWGVIITFGMVMLKELIWDLWIKKGEFKAVDIWAGSLGVFIGWISTVIFLLF